MGSTHYGFTPQQWISGTRSVLERLSPVTKAIVILSPTPELGFNGPDCLSAKANWPAWLTSPERCQTVLKPMTKNGVFDLLKTTAAPFRNVAVIDMRNAICPDGICRAQHNQQIVYRDGQHLTASFILSLAPELQKALSRSHIPF
ncbi:MAG: SGNH hydrolase domain-containing protein, partial [Thiomonas sp.]